MLSHMPWMQTTNTSAELSFLTAPAPGSNDLLQIIVTADMGYCEVGEFVLSLAGLDSQAPLIEKLGWSPHNRDGPHLVPCCRCPLPKLRRAAWPAQSAARGCTGDNLTQLPQPALDMLQRSAWCPQTPAWNGRQATPIQSPRRRLGLYRP